MVAKRQCPHCRCGIVDGHAVCRSWSRTRRVRTTMRIMMVHRPKTTSGCRAERAIGPGSGSSSVGLALKVGVAGLDELLQLGLRIGRDCPNGVDEIIDRPLRNSRVGSAARPPTAAGPARPPGQTGPTPRPPYRSYRDRPGGRSVRRQPCQAGHEVVPGRSRQPHGPRSRRLPRHR